MAYILVLFLEQQSGVEGPDRTKLFHLSCKHLSGFQRAES